MEAVAKEFYFKKLEAEHDVPPLPGCRSWNAGWEKEEEER